MVRLVKSPSLGLTHALIDHGEIVFLIHLPRSFIIYFYTQGLLFVFKRLHLQLMLGIHRKKAVVISTNLRFILLFNELKLGDK